MKPKRETKAELKKRLSERGRKGGLIGGPARALALTPERRREIATIASWAKIGRKYRPQEVVEGRPRNWAA